MPASFPSTVVLRYPVTQTLAMPVDVVEFLDGTEQRWRTADALQGFELTFPDVPIADLADLRTFWNTVKGCFDSGFGFTFQGAAYADLGMEADELTEVETRAEKTTVSVKLRQTVAHGTYTGTPASSYPALYGSVMGQRPFTAKPKWLTTRNDLASGPRVAWSEWSQAKAAWTIEHPCLTATELAARLAFFIAQGGKLRPFSFTDPNTGTTHANCRLNMDTLAVRWIGAGQCSVTVELAEFFV